MRLPPSGFLPLLALALLVAPAPAPCAAVYPIPRIIPFSNDVMAVGIGDYDGDGWPDLWAQTYYYGPDQPTAFLFRGDGWGNLRDPVPPPVQGDLRRMIVADLDGDGRKDLLYVADYTRGYEARIRYATGVDVPLPASTATARAVVGHFNDDALPDVAVDRAASLDDSFLDVYLQAPGGSFTLASSRRIPRGTVGLGAGDLDGDGRDELVLFGYPLASELAVLRPSPDGDFSDPEYLHAPEANEAFAVGDVDGDGRAEILLTSWAASDNVSNRLWIHSLEGGTLISRSLPTGQNPKELQLGDVNGDGATDVVVTQGGWSVAQIYVQGPQGLSSPPQLVWLPFADTYPLAVGDLDLDGRDDVAIADYNDGVVLLLSRRGKIPPNTKLFRASGGKGSVDFVVSGRPGSEVQVDVSITGEAPWVFVDGPARRPCTLDAAGRGTVTVKYQVLRNETATSRSAALATDRQAFEIRQDGVPCKVGLRPSSSKFTAGAGEGSFTVQAPEGCRWGLAAEVPPWIQFVTPAEGSGVGDVRFAVAENPTGKRRSAKITVAPLLEGSPISKGRKSHAVSQRP